MSAPSAAWITDRCPGTALVDFRFDLHQSLARWAEATFELCEATPCLPAPGTRKDAGRGANRGQTAQPHGI